MRYSRYANKEITTMQAMLEMHTVDELKKMVKPINSISMSLEPLLSGSLNKLPTRKQDIINWIAAFLGDRSFLQALYEKCDTIEKRTLEESVHILDGVINRPLIQAKYGAVADITIHWGRRKDAPVLALCFTSDGIMPEHLWRLMTDIVPKPEKLKLEASETLPDEITSDLFGDETLELVKHSTDKAAIQDMQSFLHLIDTGKIRVGQATGVLTKASAKTVLRHLSHGDFYAEDIGETGLYKNDPVTMGHLGIRPYAWCMLVQAGNLAKINGSHLALTKAGRTALQKPSHTTIKNLWKRWLVYKGFHEMSRIDILKGQKSKGRPLAQAPPCRSSIAEGMNDLEEGKWVQVNDFFRYLVASGNNFNAVRDPWSLYLFHQEYGSMGYDNVTWDHLEGRFARAFLLEYSATLGLIDVACILPWDFSLVQRLGSLWGLDSCTCMSRYDGLWAIRLNALGAWVLGKKKAYTPKTPEKKILRVLPNMEITLQSSLPTCPEAIYLDRFCKKISSRVWRMDLTSILEAVENKLSASHIIDFLKENSDGPIPETVGVLLQDARDRVGKVKDLCGARIIECSDPLLAQLIANDTRLNKLCMMAGDNKIVVPEEKVTKFRNALRNLGYVLG